MEGLFAKEMKIYMKIKRWESKIKRNDLKYETDIHLLSK